MPFGKSHSNKPSGSSQGHDGIFINHVTITRVQPYYDQPHEFFDRNIEFGLQLFWEFEAPSGDKWERNVLIEAAFKRDDKEMIVDLDGRSFLFNVLFDSAQDGNGDVIGSKNVNPTDDWTFEDAILRDLVGRKVAILAYRTDKSTEEKLKTSHWNMVGPGDGSRDDYLRERFLDRYHKSGYPRNYQPSGGSSTSTTFADADIPF